MKWLNNILFLELVKDSIHEPQKPGNQMSVEDSAGAITL